MQIKKENMKVEEYITIEQNTKSEITEKKSKFIGNLIKVENQEDAENKIKEIKKKYYDARHNCVAYRVINLENEQIIEKASDDGEPSGTAGGPMLNILQKNNLCNVLIVVTRYFGGILLGTGGLVRAYSEATMETIESAIKIKKIKVIGAQVNLEYNQLENFKYYCKKNEIYIENTEYGENIVCKIGLEEHKKDKLLEDFKTKKIFVKEIVVLDKKYIAKSKIKK